MTPTTPHVPHVPATFGIRTVHSSVKRVSNSLPAPKNNARNAWKNKNFLAKKHVLAQSQGRHCIQFMLDVHARGVHLRGPSRSVSRPMMAVSDEEGDDGSAMAGPQIGGSVALLKPRRRC